MKRNIAVIFLSLCLLLSMTSCGSPSLPKAHESAFTPHKLGNLIFSIPEHWDAVVEGQGLASGAYSDFTVALGGILHVEYRIAPFSHLGPNTLFDYFVQTYDPQKNSQDIQRSNDDYAGIYPAIELIFTYRVDTAPQESYDGYYFSLIYDEDQYEIFLRFPEFNESNGDIFTSIIESIQLDPITEDDTSNGTATQ